MIGRSRDLCWQANHVRDECRDGLQVRRGEGAAASRDQRAAAVNQEISQAESDLEAAQV